jgi:hypothetical protein
MKSLNIMFNLILALVLCTQAITQLHAQTRHTTQLAQECRAGGPVEACYTINQVHVVSNVAPVTIGYTVRLSIRPIDTPNVSQPVIGYWMEGRVQNADGTLTPFKLFVLRDLDQEEATGGYDTVSVPQPATLCAGTDCSTRRRDPVRPSDQWHLAPLPPIPAASAGR